MATLVAALVLVLALALVPVAAAFAALLLGSGDAGFPPRRTRRRG